MFMEFLSRGRFGLIKGICVRQHLGGVRRTELLLYIIRPDSKYQKESRLPVYTPPCWSGFFHKLRIVMDMSWVTEMLARALMNPLDFERVV